MNLRETSPVHNHKLSILKAIPLTHSEVNSLDPTATASDNFKQHSMECRNDSRMHETRYVTWLAYLFVMGYPSMNLCASKVTLKMNLQGLFMLKVDKERIL